MKENMIKVVEFHVSLESGENVRGSFEKVKG